MDDEMVEFLTLVACDEMEVANMYTIVEYAPWLPPEEIWSVWYWLCRARDEKNRVWLGTKTIAEWCENTANRRTAQMKKAGIPVGD